MTKLVKKRKPRSDRKHIIYSLTNILTGEIYIGMTVVDRGQVKQALDRRFCRHIHRAFTENKDWTLCESLRKHGPLAFDRQVIEIVRGKANAHTREREITRVIRPELNSA